MEVMKGDTGGVDNAHMSSFFIWGYYGTQYRVRSYPPFGYSILYKESYLTRFNHKKHYSYRF